MICFVVGEVMVLVSNTTAAIQPAIASLTILSSCSKLGFLQIYLLLFFLDEAGDTYHRDQEQKPVLLPKFRLL